ncbi:MAG: MdtA/MuxA family multidrug efflux RND transporter periplasmic adaptor subunit [Betaproteobacteria bacterium]|nr:MdtA/MuxA family multidrug efflux RND transporter periplasmic adaptor subunit [Betaproteobacteria bacterium]
MKLPASRLRTVLITALLAGLIGGVWLWSNHYAAGKVAAGAGGPGRPGGKNGAQPVAVETVRRMDIRIWIDALGTVTPGTLATVRPRVDGLLLHTHFKEGQQVRAGELLAEIDPRPFQVQLAQAEGQMTKDQALLDNARLDLARYRDLLAKDSIARQQVETQEALVRQYQGVVASDKAQTDNARLQLEWTRVTAPIPGRIGLRQVDAGNLVRAADANGLAVIAQTAPLSVLFSVPEAHLPAIGKRLAARRDIPVEAWDRERRTLLGKGRLLTSDNQIDAATGSIRLKAGFANADKRLFPNQFVNTRLLLDTRNDVLAVPAAAIQRGAKGIFVYSVDAAGVVATVPVVPGAVDGDWVAVEADLKPGARVVIDGVDKLRDGGKVEVIAPGGGKSGKGEKGGKHGPK